MTKVFIDGSAGTTGLRIRERLAERRDVEIIALPEEVRKDVSARQEALNRADVVFLCLPDQAAKEAVSLIEDPLVKVIDTSTAHRTEESWAYGFPEVVGKDRIKGSLRIANPGCHASGFIALIAPLRKAGLLSKDVCLTAFSLTGYTGGGKKMIAEYENEKPLLYEAPRQYGLGQAHKHLPEMKKVCDLSSAPCFCPIVGDFPCGMEVTVPLFKKDLSGTAEDVKNAYKEFYKGKIVRYVEGDENGFLSAAAYAGKDGMGVSVFGNEERILLVARFDNLGKGASGAAIQNLNLLLGAPEEAGLVL